MDSLLTLGGSWNLDSLLVFSFWLIDPDFWTNAIQVAIGIGLIIFVHELGHFMVAKFCGVRCDKFYLGFDIGGWKLWKFKAGETEYGIGILPLGGYVKMLGQEDNPGRLKEEIQRAKAGQPPLDASEEEGDEAPKPLSEEQVQELEAALYDPRSYLAQSVPKRMAIISAGVIMNLIFAFVVAAIAYGIGVQKEVCSVGSLQPGDAAWAAGLKPGDKILEINGKSISLFDDMKNKIILDDHDLEKGIPFLIQRPGISKPMTVIIHPNTTRDALSIGVGGPASTSVQRSIKGLPSIQKLSAASKAEPPLMPGDAIVEINAQKIETTADMHRVFALDRDKPLDVTVRRIDPKWDPKKAKKDEKPETITVKTQVPTEPLLGVGLIMEMGPVASVQKGSTADKAGVKPGDLITAIDGNEPGDPMTLEHRLRDRVGQTVQLTVTRDGKKLEIPITVGPDDSWSMLLAYNNSLLAVPELGVALRIPAIVAGTVPDSPAAKAGVKPGWQIKSVTMIPPKEDKMKKILNDEEMKNFSSKEITFSFDEPSEKKRFSWPDIFGRMQGAYSFSVAKFKAKFKFTFGNGKEVTLIPVSLEGQYNPERGIAFEPIIIEYQAKSMGEAASLGAKETLAQTTLVFRFLKKLFSGDISPKALGGPGTIVFVASQYAEKGLSSFLLFLTLISANLAVINFLPIPVLDGGHMVFLTYELIRRKPANEQVQIALSYLGLLFILALMIWVIGLDIVRFAFS